MSHTLLAFFSAFHFPSTFTISVYHGSSGTSGFEGTVTCHIGAFKDHDKLELVHRCSAIIHALRHRS